MDDVFSRDRPCCSGGTEGVISSVVDVCFTVVLGVVIGGRAGVDRTLHTGGWSGDHKTQCNGGI